MATDFNSEVSASLTSETKLTLASGRVANFSYDSDAYNNDTVAGVEEYNYDEHQNIPLGDSVTLNTDSSILNKGVRSQASSLTRMMLNHFFGRTSYNVNKLADHLKNFLTLFRTFIKEGDNAWSPTVIYEEGDIVYVMSVLNYEPCKRTFKCIATCPDVNYPPVYTDGSLINTTYWKEVSGRVASLTVGTVNSGKTNVATFNGSITINGDITQSGTPYETHAEQIYTKKDNIITREDATGALPSGEYSGIKVSNYDGNDSNGILAYRSDGTAVVGDESGSPSVENLQPLLTRAEASEIFNGAPLVWDAEHKRAVGGSTSGVSVITTDTTVVNNIPLSNNDSIRIMFTADILDTSANKGNTPLTITYNDVSVPVKANKNGTLVNVFAKEIQANSWKYLQAWTVIELINRTDYDGQGNRAFIITGNPVLISNADSSIYANGRVGIEPVGTIRALSTNSIPYGWLLCNGSAVSRSKYSDLFGKYSSETVVIGGVSKTLLNVYGAGDGVNTFNVPDYRELALIGEGQNGRDVIAVHDVYALGEFRDDQIQNHTHGLVQVSLANSRGGSAGDVIATGTGYQQNTGDVIVGANVVRAGAVTRTKQKGVTYIVKAM